MDSPDPQPLLRTQARSPDEFPDFANWPPANGADRQTPVVAADADADLRRRKLLRLREFLNGALREPDPRLAALAIPEEMILRLAVRLDDMIDRILSDPSADAARFAEIRPLVQELLRVAALAQRFAHLRLAFADIMQLLPEPR
jgi:hypothetical protein